MNPLSDVDTDKNEVKIENVPPGSSTSQVDKNKAGSINTNQDMLARIGVLFDTKTKALSNKIDDNAKEIKSDMTNVRK